MGAGERCCDPAKVCVVHACACSPALPWALHDGLPKGSLATTDSIAAGPACCYSVHRCVSDLQLQPHTHSMGRGHRFSQHAQQQPALSAALLVLQAPTQESLPSAGCLVAGVRPCGCGGAQRPTAPSRGAGRPQRLLAKGDGRRPRRAQRLHGPGHRRGRHSWRLLSACASNEGCDARPTDEDKGCMMV